MLRAQAMRPPRYALEPLAKLREKKADEAARELAGAVAGRDAAERGRRAAEQRRDSHEAAAARVRQAERGALERGELRAADLARADGWEHRVGAEGRAIAAELDRARTAETRAREAEESSRAELAAREADARVIEKDRARWQDERRKRAETREEEEAAEAYRRKG
jgi:hypothetical protein